MEEGHNFYAETPWTWRDRLRWRLFPSQHLELPEAPAAWKDVVVVQTTVHLSFVDRLRVLATGKMRVETKTVTENIVGGTLTSSAAYPLLK